MHPRNSLKKLFLYFFLLVVLTAADPCRAVTFQAIYSDGPNEGFNDPSPYANTTQTLGEVRKTAFARATSSLASRLSGSQTVRIEAGFTIFPGQEDPDDRNRCASSLPNLSTLASAGPKVFFYPSNRVDNLDFDQMGNQINPPAEGIAYPSALHKQIINRNLNGQAADIFILFSKCLSYYYGTGTTPPLKANFAQVATHEIIHGLGFLEHVQSDGSFHNITITVTGTLEGQPFTGDANLISRTIYDEQLYSEAADGIFVDISAAARSQAIKSVTGLLWEGKDGGSRSCSFGQRMAELKSASAKSSDGKPRLHAPASYSSVSSVAHVHSSAQDIMEFSLPSPDNMDLTLGMLKDMGWGISASGFPQSCEPTGITVTSAPPLRTTEGGGEAKFSVKLDSRPSSSVRISVTSSDPAEGTVSLPSGAGELTFSTSAWNIPQEVTVTGVDDGLCDGAENYQINIGNAQSSDRFYKGFTPTPSRLSAINSPASTLSIDDSNAEEGDGSIDFTVNLASPQNRQVTVQYETTDGSAQGGSDYVSQPLTTITFAACETQKSISLALMDDSTDEKDETFSVTLKNPTNAALDQNKDVATATIKDDDGPRGGQVTPVVSVNSPGVTEGGSGAKNLEFKVSLNSESSNIVTVNYEDSGDGSATAGADYAAITKGTLTFEPKETNKTVPVSVTGDTTDEPNETVILALSSPVNATLSGGKSTLDARGTITDDDPTTVTLAAGSSDAIPEAGGQRTFSVTLSRALVSPETLSVPLSLEGQAKLGGDYKLACPNPLPAGVTCSQNLQKDTFTVAFTGGSNSAKTIELTLSAVDDNENEGTGETVEITLDPASGTNLGGGTRETGSVSFSITDDDAGTVPTISVDAGAAVTEGKPASFTIRSNPPPAGTLTVNLSVSQSGSFVGQSNHGGKQISVSASTTPYRVATAGDSTDEPAGSVTVAVNPGNGYIVSGTGSFDRVAVGDDDPTTITVSSAPPGNINEDNGTKSVTVTLGRSLVAGERIIVPLIFGGTATHGTDYSLAGTDKTGVSYSGLDSSGNTPSVTFTGGAGSSSTSEVTITPIPDRTDEGTGETVTVRLGTFVLTGLDSARVSGSVNFSITDNENTPTTPPSTESGSSAGGCALVAAGGISRGSDGTLNFFASALFLLFMFYGRGKNRKRSI